MATLSSTPLNRDCLYLIFNLLNGEDLLNCRRVCKQWKAIIDTNENGRIISLFEKIGDVRERFIGKHAWKKHFNYDCEESYLPISLAYPLLSASCPIWNDHKLSQTHLFLFIPSRMTINTFVDLTDTKDRKGHSIHIHSIWDQIQMQIGDVPTEQGYWILFTKNNIEDTRGKDYDEQHGIVISHQHYRPPRLLEALIGVVFDYVIHGITHFGAEPLTYTSTDQEINDYHICVGGFSHQGIDVTNNVYFGAGHEGCAAVRQISS